MLRTRFVLAIPLLLASVVHAQSPFVWDQSDFTICCVYDISSYSVANDFTLSTAHNIVAADLFLLDGDGVANGVFGSFTGVVGWAIYNDAAGGHPGALIASGTDSAPVVTDTGLDFGDDEIFRVTIALTPPVALAPGSWWLAIHQGAWSSGAQSALVSAISSTYWVNSVTTLGRDREFSSYDPGEWTPLFGDGAFIVYGVPSGSPADLIFASGFEAGVTCGWTSGPGALYVTCP